MTSSMATEFDFEDFSSQDELCKKDSIMKTAWIRVSRVNYTGQNKDVIEEYTVDRIKCILKEWSKSTRMDYFLIDHVPDDDDPNEHCHFAIRFYSPTRFSVIKNKFPFGNIQLANKIKNCVRYLVHADHPEKKPYAWSDIITNADLTRFKVQSRSQQEISLQRILERIESGEVTRYNYHLHIPIDLYAKNERVITSAFSHKESSLTYSPHREIKVIYLYGKSRIGKSRFAYDYAKALYPGEEPANSSAKNDPLQDYRGQKVFIWNEFRDTHMAYSDLLSFIDPHYRSSGKSRYHNKPFLGDVIIFTSTQAIDFLYKNVPTNDGMAELRNRITEYHEFVEDKVNIYLGDGKNHFVLFRSHLNPYYGMASTSLSDNEESFNYSVYEKLGLTLSKPSPSSPVNLPSPLPSLSEALVKHHRAVDAGNWYESADGKRYLADKEAMYAALGDSGVKKTGLDCFGGGLNV